MRSSITKLAVAAVIIAVVVLGLVEFIGTGSKSKSGVVWAEVAQKVEASRGLVYRQRTFADDESDEGAYIMFYVSPTYARMDTYEAGEVIRSIYCDYASRDMLIIQQNDKCYYHHPMEDRDVRDHERELNLKSWVRQVLSGQYTNLGHRTIGGVLCEGIETKYPIFGDTDSPIKHSARRVWVSTETGYPLLCEGGELEDDGKLRVEAALDQFQWDVELDASLFEPNIPPDYEQM